MSWFGGSSSRKRRLHMTDDKPTVTEHGMNLLEEVAPPLQEINETMFGTFSKTSLRIFAGSKKC